MSAQASALTFEPYYGLLSNSKSTYQYNGTPATAHPDVYIDTLKGSAYGVRALQSYYFMFLGADYMFGRGKSKIDPDVGDPDGKFKTKDLYAVAGFGDPGGFRIWYAHGIKSEFEREDSGTLTKLKGDAYKIGICIGFSYFSLNAEYLKWNFKKYERGNAAGPVGDIYKRFDTDAILFSLSLPFTF
jgi:hypothetical protein